MKRIVCALVLAALMATAGFAAMKNTPEGFRGVKWGDPVSKLGTYTKIDEGPYLKAYTRKGDKLAIGDAQLAIIAYLFVENKFMGVTIRAQGETNKNALLRAMKSQYGEPEQKNKFIDDFYWADPDVVMVFEYNQFSEITETRISSLEKLQLLTKLQDDAAKKAADDF